MSEPGFRLGYDTANRVLLIGYGARVTDDSFRAAADAIRRFRDAHGTGSFIMDLSQVENFDVSHELLRMAGTRLPENPRGRLRIIVAPRPFVHRLIQMVETYRLNTAAPLKVVRSIDEAYAACGTAAQNFAPVAIPEA